MYDFTFLAPCPSSGIIVQGGSDEVVTAGAVQKLVDKLRTQKHITIHHDEIPRANHFFEHEMDQLMKSVDNYLDMRLAPDSPVKCRSNEPRPDLTGRRLSSAALRGGKPERHISKTHQRSVQHQQTLLV